jgi:hypothetical protein
MDCGMSNQKGMDVVGALFKASWIMDEQRAKFKETTAALLAE